MNKKFKVGDMVRRTIQDHGWGAKVGQIAEVKEVTPYGTLIVIYTGFKPPQSGLHAGKGEIWMDTYAERVHTPEESVCKFVPGKVYKDSIGGLYKLVAYVPAAIAAQRAVFVNDKGSVCTRHIDGRVMQFASSISLIDILPNKATRIINVYRDERGDLYAIDEDGPSASSFKEDEAKGYARKIGEVVEEYGEF